VDLARLHKSGIACLASASEMAMSWTNPGSAFLYAFLRGLSAILRTCFFAEDQILHSLIIQRKT
jgi:hypothetical protein